MPTVDNLYSQPSQCQYCREADLSEAQCLIGECRGQCSECDAVVEQLEGALA